MKPASETAKATLLERVKQNSPKQCIRHFEILCPNCTAMNDFKWPVRECERMVKECSSCYTTIEVTRARYTSEGRRTLVIKFSLSTDDYKTHSF